MSELKMDLETHCVGRYLIDVPKKSHVSGSASLNGVRLEAVRMSEDEFLKRTREREAELEHTVNFVDGYRVLYERGPVPGITHSAFFVSLDNPEAQASDMPRVIEAYRWDRGYRIELKAQATDMVNSVYVKKNKGTPYAIPGELKNDVPERMRLVFDLLSRVEGRDEHVIPTTPGVCFLGGFMRGPATNKEEVSGTYVMEGKEDVSFNLESDSSLRETSELLERGDGIDDALKQRNGHTVRKGKIQINGLQAQEWLLAGKTDSGVSGHRFALEANSKVGGALTPLLMLDMDNGRLRPSDNRVEPLLKSSLSEGEAVALWDAVSRTLRPRPNGF